MVKIQQGSSNFTAGVKQTRTAELGCALPAALLLGSELSCITHQSFTTFLLSLSVDLKGASL